MNMLELFWKYAWEGKLKKRPRPAKAPRRCQFRPHQGKAEIARRAGQIARGVLHTN